MSERVFWTIICLLSVVGFVLTFANIFGIYIGYILLLISLIIFLRFLVIIVEKKRVSVDLLMGIAGLTTWFLGAYLEGYTIFVLYSISEIIETIAEKYAIKKITGLKDLVPSRAVVVRNSKLAEIPVHELEVDDIVLVKPGEAIAVDGVIVKGESLFDTSYITGEPYPILLKRGNIVPSGFINIGNNIVKVKALKKPSESLLQILVVEAEKALKKKTLFQKYVERISQPYTLLVLLVFMLSSMILGPYRSLSILLAGCPSAFIISSSIATTLTIALLARNSIVVRGGIVLENFSKTKIIIFDKTGTLTLGRLKVVDVIAFNKFSVSDIRFYASAASKASIHPIAKAVSRLDNSLPEKAIEYPGKGVEAIVSGRQVLIGSLEFLKDKDVKVNVSGVNGPCSRGDRIVYVAIDKEFAGAICLSEELVENIEKVMKELKRYRLKIVVASGDEESRVKNIAKKIGADEYYARLSPHEKIALVRKYKTLGKTAMVGDGINDLEALAEADVGIAVGSLSTVSSIADAVIVKGIHSLPYLVSMAKKYMSALYYTIPLTMAIKITIMMLGLIGAIPLWAVVGLGDDGTTILAIVMSVASLLRK